MTDFSINIHFLPCMHRQITTVVTGGVHFSESDVWDDIQEKLLCLDCLEYVTEAEVRTAWGQCPVSTEEVPHDID